MDTQYPSMTLKRRESISYLLPSAIPELKYPKGWKRGKNEPVKNVDLWKRLLQAKAPHAVKFVWVKGHAGHPQNERCDELATYAADSGPLLEDTGAEL